jgi:hypothetical protein
MTDPKVEIRGQTGRVLYGNEKPYVAVLFDFCICALQRKRGEPSFDPLSTPVFPKYQSRLTTNFPGQAKAGLCNASADS